MLRTILIAILLATLGSARAAEDGKTLQDQLAEFSTDLSMPASPAAVHVGLTAESVLMPRNRREFEAGLSNVFKGTGKPTGTLEFAPYYIFRGGKLPFARYRSDGSFRTLTKTTLGIATGTRKIGDAEISATGLSLSTVLADLGDPIYSHALQACINDVQAGMLERARAREAAEPQPLPGEDSTSPFERKDEIQDEQASADYKACIAQREPQLWNRSRLSLGLATGRGREAAGLGRRVDFGNGLWISAQYGFEGLAALKRTLLSDSGYYDCVQVAGAKCAKRHEPTRWERHAMLTLHARRTSGAADLDLSQPGELPELTSTLVGARLTYGSTRRAVFLEASRSSLKGGAIDKRTEQHALGASFRVSENLWINAISGRRKQFANGRLENVVDLNLQYGAASEPLVAPH